STSMSDAGAIGVAASRSQITTSASNDRPRANGAPLAMKPQLRPSNTRSSLPPNWLTYRSGTACRRAIVPSISSPPRCLPAVNGGVRLGQSDQYRREGRGVASEHRERSPAALDEFGAEQQVARQIADERQLGRHGEVGSGGCGAAECVENQPGIAGEVADRRV